MGKKAQSLRLGQRRGEAQVKASLQPSKDCAFTHEQLVAAYEAGMSECRGQVSRWEKTRTKPICRKDKWDYAILHAIIVLTEAGEEAFLYDYRNTCHAAGEENYNVRWRPVFLGYAAIMNTLGIQPPDILPANVQADVGRHFHRKKIKSQNPLE